jgi:endonuclease I
MRVFLSRLAALRVSFVSRRGCSLLATFAVLAAIPSAIWGAYEPPNAAYAPPVGYYNAATGTGTTLRLNLHNIISTNYHGISYGDARYALAITDQDPNSPNNILLVYNRASVSGTWDTGVTWNREHLWPQSKLGVSVTNSYIGPASDLFELKPCNPSINSSRSNDAYGTPTSTGGYFNGAGYFFPGDADKGDVARSMFYMATRYYNGSGTPSIQNLSLVNDYAIATYQMGDLKSLLHWNYTDGVDNFERRRNQMIYNDTVNPAYSQNNRNPFIDHPEYVWAIFGPLSNEAGISASNDSQISVATPDSSGASSTTANLGRIMLNHSFGTSTVTVSKIGVDPTTFDIISTGSAMTVTTGAGLPIGTGQPFDFGIQSKPLVVGLSAPTSSTGQKSGLITITNTDLTSSDAGRGSADGNDMVQVVGTVVDNRIVSASAVDLGAVHFGGSASGGTNLATSGDDDHFTRVTVAGQLFNSATSTGTAAISPTLGTAGLIAASVSLPTTGEQLVGETPVPVSVPYTAQVFTGKMSWKPSAGSGNWSDDANWSDTQSSATAGAPGLAGNLSLADTASFDNASAPTTVSLNNASPHVGAITFSGANAYTIAQGMGTGVLHIDYGTSAASVMANSGGHQLTAPVAFDSATTVKVTNSGDTLTFAGPISNAIGLTKTGDGTVDVQGPTHLAAGSHLSVSAGTLRLAVGPGSTVGAGVVATVAVGATLELAGTTSPLAPLGLTGTDRPSIKNAGTLSVTGFQSIQVVGGIDGGGDQAGVTSVADSASLTADHIIQSALLIGGDQAFPALVTIAPSDASGNPLDVGAALVSGPSASSGSEWLNDGFFVNSANGGLDNGVTSASGELPLAAGSSVPEPATPALVFAAFVVTAVTCRRWQRVPHVRARLALAGNRRLLVSRPAERS